MKIFMGFLVLVVCTVHHVTSLGHGQEVESWRTNILHTNQNHNVRNPLLGSSSGLNVLHKLQNIRNKLEEIEKKNTDLPVISAVRGPENQFQSINSFVDDLPVTTDNKERANALEIQPFSMLEKIPVMPSSLNGYFLMLRLKQNVSKSVPTKSQSRFLGNEQQHFVQQISTQSPEPAVSQQQPLTKSQTRFLGNEQQHFIQQISAHSPEPAVSQQQPLTKSQTRFLGNEQQHFIQQISTQTPETTISQQQPFTIHRQFTSQQSLNNQQMHIRRLNTQDQSSNHDSSLRDQQNLVNQQQLAKNQGHHLSELQRSINQQPSIDHRSPDNSQQFSNNERSILNGQQNGLRPVSTEKTLINQHHSVRNLQQTIQQQPPTNTHRVPGQQGILRISHHSTTNQYIRPEERISSSLPITENPTHMVNFEYPSGQQIQAFADEVLEKIQTQSLNEEPQPAFIDNLNRKTQSRIISAGAKSHQASMLADLEISPVAHVSGSQILHETRLSTGASVKQHLKTPYTNYDFSHLL